MRGGALLHDPRMAWPAQPLRVELALAQLDPPDLPGQRLGQPVGELDPARVRVRAQPAAHERLDLIGHRVGRLDARPRRR